MTDKPERDFFQTVVISGIRHPAMVAGLVAGLLSGGFVAGTGWNVMQTQIAEVSRDVNNAQASMQVLNQDIRSELKRIEIEMRGQDSIRETRIDRISTDVGEMKADLRAVNTAIQFLVQHQRQQTRNNSGTTRSQ